MEEEYNRSSFTFPLFSFRCYLYPFTFFLSFHISSLLFFFSSSFFFFFSSPFSFSFLSFLFLFSFDSFFLNLNDQIPFLSSFTRLRLNISMDGTSHSPHECISAWCGNAAGRRFLKLREKEELTEERFKWRSYTLPSNRQSSNVLLSAVFDSAWNTLKKGICTYWKGTNR